MSNPIARMMVKSMAMQLASFPDSTLENSSCSPTLVEGIKAAREAFKRVVSDAEVRMLMQTTFEEMRTGLTELAMASGAMQGTRVTDKGE